MKTKTVFEPGCENVGKDSGYVNIFSGFRIVYKSGLSQKSLMINMFFAVDLLNFVTTAVAARRMLKKATLVY